MRNHDSKLSQMARDAAQAIVVAAVLWTARTMVDLEKRIAVLEYAQFGKVATTPPVASGPKLAIPLLPLTGE